MRPLAVLTCCALLAACGNEDSSVAEALARKPKVQVHPEAVTLAPAAVQAFSVTPASLAVAWSVAEAGGGTITSAGLYTAPAAQGIYHVVASSGTASGQATVTVDSGVRIVATSPVTVKACDSVQLQATVTGSADTGVVWSVDPACGAISASGLFTAAQVTGTCTALAVAHADPTQSATVALTLTQPEILSVAVIPLSVTLVPGGAQQFTATITTKCGTSPAGG